MGLVVDHIHKDFGKQKVLKDINFKIENGEYVSISGRSGSGKSTLLYILSTLDIPTAGDVFLDECNTKKMNDHEIDVFRAKHIGFIFQFHYLIPELTTLENVLLPATNLKVESSKVERAKELLNELEILDQIHKYPSQMSGGQQQRVAIARALIMEPKYIFADEPTGNLDTYNAAKVMDMLDKINRESKTTIVLVTHDPDFAARAKREILLSDGRVVN